MDNSFSPGARSLNVPDADPCLADRIAAARILVQSAKEEPRLAALLAEAGYDAHGLEAGLKLFEAAERALAQREAAMARLKQAADEYRAAKAAAYQSYREFRSAARFLCKDTAARLALGVEAEPPQEREKFLILARSAYRAVKSQPCYRRIAQYGCLEEAGAALERWEAADVRREAMRRTAFLAAQQYDQVILQLGDWVSPFCKAVRPRLKADPELQRRFLLANPAG